MSTTRTLIVLTSHDQLGNTGKKTGAYLSEISHVYWTLVDAGIEVDFVSPKGGQVPLDGVDRKDADNARFLDDTAVMARIANVLRPDQVEPSRYAAIYYAGGHGTMWDLPDDQRLAQIAASIYDAGGIVSAVCHGPSGLVNIKLSSGGYLVANKELAAFTDAEERAVNLTEVVPFLLASKLVERGARHIPAANFAANVVVSDRLITGQNPASARGVGEALVAALGRGTQSHSQSRTASN
jgi:putative intracellular protease/amidase